MSRKRISIAAMLALSATLGIAGIAPRVFATPPDEAQTPLNDEQRYDLVNGLDKKAQAALKAGKMADAAKFAQKALDENTDTTSWNYGNVIYSGNEILGLVALSKNDIKSADNYLMAAGATPGSPQLDTFGPDMTLAAKLYEHGERGSLLLYLDEIGKFWGSLKNSDSKDGEYGTLSVAHAARLAQWKQQIRQNEKPDFINLFITAAPKPKVANTPQSAPDTQEVALLTKGTIAPDFTVNDPSGKPVHLSDFKGKVVVLDFWATWCPPCQASMPHTNEVAHKFAGRNVVVLAVCTSDKQEAFDTWIPKHKDYDAMNFTIDPASRATNIAHRLYHVTGIPTQYVIDADGKIVESFVGYGGPNEDLSHAILKSNGVLVQAAAVK